MDKSEKYVRKQIQRSNFNEKKALKGNENS